MELRRIDPLDAPSPILRNYCFGRIGGIVAFLSGRRTNGLVVLVRNAGAAPPAFQGAPGNLFMRFL